MRPEHSLDVMSSNFKLIHADDLEGDRAPKRTRYDSNADAPKRFKSSHIDMELSDDEEDTASTSIEIIEIEDPPLPPLPLGEPEDEEDIEVLAISCCVVSKVVYLEETCLNS